MATKNCLTAIQTADLMTYLRGVVDDKNHVAMTPSQIIKNTESILGKGASPKTVLNYLRQLEFTHIRENINHPDLQTKVAELETKLNEMHDWLVLEDGPRYIDYHNNRVGYDGSE